MFLLRLEAGLEIVSNLAEFTFQYVSIKTFVSNNLPTILKTFTFQYVSIKTLMTGKQPNPSYEFTFQYVSIKTD